MKTIMIPIVTILLGTLTIQASTLEVNNAFTVTQIALDAAAENATELQQALIEIEEDENSTNKGGDAK